MHHTSPLPNPTGGNTFIDAAKIRILLTPVGDVSTADFERWCAHVRNFDVVPLKDLPGAAARKWPQNGSPLRQAGEVHISFVTAFDTAHSFLAPFNMHRQALGVLGLTTFSPRSDRESLERAPGALRQRHPGAIVHRVYGFDTSTSRPQTMDLSSVPDIAAKIDAAGGQPTEPSSGGDDGTTAAEPADQQLGMPRSTSARSIASEASSEGGFLEQRAGGLIIFPAVRKDAKDVNFYLRTLIAELVATILDGLDDIVSSLEGTPLETPRETLDGIVTTPPNSASVTSPTSPTSGTSLGTAASTAASRASALFSSFGGSSSSSGTGTPGGSNSGATPAARPVSAIGGGTQPDMGIPSTPSRPLSAAASEAKRRTILSPVSSAGKKGKKTSSIGGVGPTGSGRFAKVRADFYLLAGDLWAALEGYDAALSYMGKERALAGGQDAVWYASALEGWAVTKVLVWRMGGEVLDKAPAFDLPAGIAAASAKEKEKDKDKVKDAKDGGPYARQPWSDIAEAYSLALTIYSKCLAPPHTLLEPARSVTNETPRDFTHPLIHTGACIQYARFLLAVWASAGWNGECFDQLLYGGVPPALAEETRPSQSAYLLLSSMSGVQRHDIAAAASSALTQSVAALKATDQVTVLSTLTGLFGCIGFTRREAYVLRQLQAVIVSLLAKSLLQQAGQPTTASTLPLLRAAADEDELLDAIMSQVVHHALGSGPEAVLVLAMQVCETYGIHVEVDPLKGVPRHHILSRAGKVMLSAYTSPNPEAAASADGAADQWGGPAKRDSVVTSLLSRLELEGEVDFGWPEQQVALLKDTVSVAEMLSDSVSMAFFAAILLRDFHSLLSAAEQRRLYDGLLQVSANARTSSAPDIEVRYWGPAEPLCSLSFAPLPNHLMPSERRIKDLHAAPITAAKADEEGTAGLNNPFFWNPTSSGGGGGSKTNSWIGGKDGSLTVVAREPFEVLATVQNPLAIDVEFESVKIITEGVDCEAAATRTVAPAKSFHTFRLSGTAATAGTLKVKGVSLKLAGCCEETFLLPIQDEQAEREQQRKAAEVQDRRARIKEVGLDARPAVVKHRDALADADGKAARRRTTSHRGSTAESRYLTCRVAPPQPLLRVECAALQSGKLHAFEGEEQTIQIDVTNTSESVAVDFARLSFWDNLSESAKQVLVEGSLLPSDAHELEWDLLYRPVFEEVRPLSSNDSSARPNRVSIEPGSTTSLSVRVLGKLDCTQGRIMVEYAHLDLERAGGTGDGDGKFYTRQATLPIQLSVQPVLECGRIEVRPLRADEAAWMTAQSLATSEGVSSSLFEGKSGLRSRSLIGAVAATRLEDGSPARSATELHGEDDGGESALVAASVRADPDRFCLLSIDVRNASEQSVALRLAIGSSAAYPLCLHRLIRAGGIARLTFPFPRASLPPSTSEQPIPALSRRQFVVSRLIASPQEERAEHTRFWYRKHMLGQLEASWVLPTSSEGQTGQRLRRGGELVGLRTQPLSNADVVTLRREGVRVECTIFPSSSSSSSSPPSPRDPSSSTSSEQVAAGTTTTTTTTVPHETGVTISVRICNLTNRARRLRLRLVPVLPSPPGGKGTGEREREDALLASLIWTRGNANERIKPWPLPPSISSSSSSVLPSDPPRGDATKETGKMEETGWTTVEKEVLFLSSGLFGFVVVVEEDGRRSPTVGKEGEGGRKEEEERVEYVSKCPVLVVVT